MLALCTGSQGEPRAALSRIAEDEHPEVTLAKGDRVIFSSRAIPGNEKAVARVINGLVSQGVEVITDRTHLVHVSGHPRRAELLDMIGWVRPKILIPAHGEALHLAEHAELAPPRRRAARAGLPQRRSGPPRAGRRPNHRRGALGPALQGRRAPDQRRARRRAASFRHVTALLTKGAHPRIELIGIPESDAGIDAIAVASGLIDANRAGAIRVVEVRRGVRGMGKGWNKTVPNLDEVPSGGSTRTARSLISAEAKTVAARRRLSFSGIVTVALALSEKGALVADPEIELIGIPETDAGGASMTEIARDAVEEAFESMPKPRRRDPDAVAEAVRRAVRGAIAQRWNKKPICHVHVLEV